ncbi:MAG: tetratricopeptide repeat protein [Nitrospinae bacterium]|nr:tetratricopeptide repeat protein [Nitrospinota bacterium]MBL7020910.1 tetratricopeptide repeat protein [Nitrospinaceae bacterium]
MAKKKIKKKQELSSFKSAGLSTLGEKLKSSNPDLVERFEAIQGVELTVPRLVQVMEDLLPYPWDDIELFEEAIKLTAQGFYGEAVAVCGDVLRLNPTAYPAYHLLGHIFGAMGNHREEIEHYRKAVRLKPNYPQIYFDLATAYWISGKEKKSFTALKNTIPMAPDFAVADYWLTFIFDRLGRNRDIYQVSENESLVATETFAQICGLLGVAFLEYGYHASARQAFKKAVRVCPDFAEGHYQLGMLHLKKLRNPKRAEKYLEAAEQLYIRKNDFHRAALTHQMYRPKAEVHDQNKASEDWLKEGLRLQGLNRYQEAVDAYRMAQGFKPDFLDAFYNMGVAYGCMEENGIDALHKAVWVFKKAIDINAEFIHSYTALGASYIKQNELELAIQVLTRALGVDPEDSNVYYYLGIACRMNMLTAQAVDYMRQAVALKPDSVQVQFYFGLSLMDMELFDEACAAFREVVRIKPDFSEGHLMLGKLYRENLMDMDKSTHHLKKAEKLFVKLEDYQRVGQIRQLLSRRSK